ncbi:PTS sugar transporter subunit IIA [Oscillochloris sp. ZM17-4]|uniref:PTS sugar transporter subunit IIA n=1 Tax=Oscillochloris sp. ZM17-4 TaxID=2866714 RepID=UPI0021027B9C|nr:PTS sugar transporter subunit IIA [Oscillochloris sp. ZM17-4]
MAIISTDRVRLGAVAADKADAIRQAGELLVAGGCVEPPYVDGMLGREAVMSTYLGNGISIPHGQFEDQGYIKSTGISVLQVPAGVEWEPGELAYLIVGIAAVGDEHIGVMANLAEVIEDPAMAEELVRATSPQEIVDRLSREAAI